MKRTNAVLVENIKTICNLGTGTMGFGTALMFAVHGYDVRMFGRFQASIRRCFDGITRQVFEEVVYGF